MNLKSIGSITYLVFISLIITFLSIRLNYADEIYSNDVQTEDTAEIELSDEEQLDNQEQDTSETDNNVNNIGGATDPISDTGISETVSEEEPTEIVRTYEIERHETEIFDFNGVFGLSIVFINDIAWTKLSGLLHFHFWDDIIGFGLDLSAEFSPSAIVRMEKWNRKRALYGIIDYVRVGHQREDPYFFQIGPFNYVSLGHGTMMCRFANNVFMPSFKKLGVQLEVDLEYAGASLVMDDITVPETFFSIAGGRIFIRPLLIIGLDNTTFSRAHIGGTFIIHKNPFETDVLVKSSDPFENEIERMDLYDLFTAEFSGANGIWDYVPSREAIPGIEKDEIRAYGFDIGVPVLSNFIANVDVYIDYNVLMDDFWGVHYGGKVTLLPETAKIDVELEFVNFKAGYFPRYFHKIYLARSPYQLLQATEYSAKDRMMYGWMFNFYRTFLDGDGGVMLSMDGIEPDNIETYPNLYFRFWLKNWKYMPGFTVYLEYYKRGARRADAAFITFDDDSSITFSLAYRISYHIELAIYYSKMFIYSTYGEEALAGVLEDDIIMDPDTSQPKIIFNEFVLVETRVYF